MYQVTGIEFYESNGGGEAFLAELGKEASSSEFLQDIHLMEFTGLHDKNGNEIYEGDVVRMPAFNPELNVVRFNRGGFCLEPIINPPLEIHFWPDIKYAEDDRSEVIGNIYENPELLASQSTF